MSTLTNDEVKIIEKNCNMANKTQFAQKLKALQEEVANLDLAGIEADILALQGDMTTAEGDIAALEGLLDSKSIRVGTITLNGVNPTPIVFGDATAAVLTSSNAETFDMTGVGNGGTLIFTVDGGEEATATINAAAGTSTSGATPSTDISTETDTKFNISVDGDEAEEVTLVVSEKNTGELIAAEIQSKIQALGGNKASVTCAYSGGVYVVTSPTLGTDSSVVITPAESGSLTEELKLGTADGGVEAAGTGDVADLSVVTADEIIGVLTSDVSGATATKDGTDHVVLTSDTTGKDSSIVVGGGTLNTVVGFTESGANYGAQSLGYAIDMANGTYQVVATLNGVAQAQLASKNLSVTSKATSGFNIECETAAATDNVDVVIIGTSS